MDVEYFLEQHIVIGRRVQLGDLIHHVIEDEHLHNHVHDLDHFLRIENLIHYSVLEYFQQTMQGKQINQQKLYSMVARKGLKHRMNLLSHR